MAENPDKSTPGSEEPVATRLILVRHGKTATTGQVLPGRAHGLLLAEEGRSQAEEVAKELAFIEKIAAIYSSPLERAMETAAPLAAARQMVPLVDERLYECDFGSWTGRRLDELTKLPEWRVIQHSPSKFTFPEGESFRSMSTRMVDFLEWVHASHRGETVVAFSHADPIKALVAHCLGMHLDSFQRIVISTAGITGISITDGANYALFVNSTPKPNLKVS
ncbi:MAG: histidine phosphatase family protein [Nitrospiraceae bacterium]|nr:histidine phosphatase family protein [Nitrospiraceae bacterium]